MQGENIMQSNKKDIISRVVAIIVLAAAFGHVNISAQDNKTLAADITVKRDYASVNGLKMYYEIHGTGKPVVLLHGAFGLISGWGPLLNILAKERQVIAVELQGHGHTGDIDRPLSYEQMADDTAALLKHLRIDKADIFGYSMGGTVALYTAIKHPALVGKIAILGSSSGPDAWDPETFKQFQSITPENFAPAPLKDPYDKAAPDPKKWPVLVAKITTMVKEFKGISDKDMQSIRAPFLVMHGDRDAFRVEHAVKMYRLVPNSQLRVFPNGDHFVLFTQPDRVTSSLQQFLNEPATEAKL